MNTEIKKFYEMESAGGSFDGHKYWKEAYDRLKEEYDAFKTDKQNKVSEPTPEGEWSRDKVNAILSNVMRFFNSDEKIALRDKLIRRTPKESNSLDAINFMKFAFENYHWTGDTWDENTGHDDFESYTIEELYNIYTL